jgi:hypothetical protein
MHYCDLDQILEVGVAAKIGVGSRPRARPRLSPPSPDTPTRLGPTFLQRIMTLNRRQIVITNPF